MIPAKLIVVVADAADEVGMGLDRVVLVAELEGAVEVEPVAERDEPAGHRHGMAKGDECHPPRGIVDRLLDPVEDPLLLAPDRGQLVLALALPHHRLDHDPASSTIASGTANRGRRTSRRIPIEARKATATISTG